jgi:MoxR-like ATPase
VRRHVAWGAGPRAVQALVLAAKARALLAGRFAVTRADVREVALPVLRHRLLPSYPAEAEGLTVDDLVCRLLLEVPAFPPDVSHDALTRKILRR